MHQSHYMWEKKKTPYQNPHRKTCKILVKRAKKGTVNALSGHCDWALKLCVYGKLRISDNPVSHLKFVYGYCGLVTMISSSVLLNYVCWIQVSNSICNILCNSLHFGVFYFLIWKYMEATFGYVWHSVVSERIALNAAGRNSHLLSFSGRHQTMGMANRCWVIIAS